MNKYFVNYENALELKELGFNEPCFGYYSGRVLYQHSFSKETYANQVILAPLFHQAFEFILNKLEDRYDLIRYEIFSDKSGFLSDRYHLDNLNLNFELSFDNLNEAVKVGINLIKENEKSEEY